MALAFSTLLRVERRCGRLLGGDSLSAPHLRRCGARHTPLSVGDRPFNPPDLSLWHPLLWFTPRASARGRQDRAFKRKGCLSDRLNGGLLIADRGRKRWGCWLSKPTSRWLPLPCHSRSLLWSPYGVRERKYALFRLTRNVGLVTGAFSSVGGFPCG
jgi:hypothetical protein